MKILTVTLPDKVFESASEEAQEQEIDVASLCSGVLSDYFLNTGPAENLSKIPRESNPSPKINSKTEAHDAKTGFNVATELVGFPLLSVRFAQQFVDEALRLPGVRAFKDKRGVGFEPNFVYIEYVMTRRSGIAVSFFGEPNSHTNHPKILGKGRGPSYSRAKIYSQEDMNSILPHVRKAYELKFGKI
ncbi:MAG: hypothetical protein LV481_15600 [Methylacidiphilales bacterium]|nr:hypothetical protein [Candidatus Methylacidiphilales bacterium]